MKTTLKEIIEKIDLNNKGYKDTYVDVSEIASFFEIYDVYNDPAERMSAYYIAIWYCTDSYVGLIAYFLDGKFVMCSSQTARKSSIEYEFPDKESYYEVKKYIESLRQDEEDEPVIPIIDMNAETNSIFKIHFADQIMYKTALFLGHDVEIIEKNTDKEITGRKVKIKHSNGNTEIVDCRSLDFKVLTDFR